jgi:sigma-E factor negative regulatory protein RseA
MMERLSALMDGELDPEHVAHALRKAGEDEDWRKNWEVYHVIGDCLRRDAQVNCNVAAAVLARLAHEPTVLAPRPRTISERRPRFALGLAASAAGVALVAWIAFMHNPLLPTTTVVATAPDAPAATSVSKASSPRGLSNSEYLTAHQQVSPSSVVRGMAAYVSTVSAGEGEAERQ